MRQPKPRTPRVPATGTRSIVVNGAAWRWSVGKGNVSLWSPDGVRHNANASTIKGITPDVYARRLVRPDARTVLAICWGLPRSA